jgi:acyl carrier protein
MNNKRAVVEKIQGAVAGLAGSPLPAPGWETMSLLEGGIGLTSVQLIELISTLEQDLNFQFEEEDLRMRTFGSLNTLADTVMARIGSQPAYGAPGGSSTV